MTLNALRKDANQNWIEVSTNKSKAIRKLINREIAALKEMKNSHGN